MNKEEVFLKLLVMYEQAERQIAKFMSAEEGDEWLYDYGITKIKLIIKQMQKEYQEARA